MPAPSPPTGLGSSQADRSGPLSKAETLLEITMTPTSTLSYQGTTIRLRGAMLNLTDMWRAAGCPEYRRPIHWLVLEETARFRAHAQTHWTEPDGPVSPNIIQDDIIRLDPDGFVATIRGRHGGTWAHWQLALAYARYLSPAPPLVQHGGPPLHGVAARPRRTTIRCSCTSPSSSATCIAGSISSTGTRRT